MLYNTHLLRKTLMKEDWGKSIGKRMARFRKERKLTQPQLAEKLGLSCPIYGHYENGIRRLPINIIPKVVEVLEISYEELLGLSDN